MSSEGETHAQQPVEETQPAAAEELKPVATNEPVEEGGSSAAVDAVTRPLAPLLFVGLSFVTLLFLIIGTTLPWLRRDAYPAVPVIALVTLWETRVKVIPTQTVTVTKVVDNHCEILRNYFRAAEAFAIISIFFAAGTLLVGLAALAGKKVPLKPVGTILAFATFTASLIAWALMGKAYYMPYCGLASPHDQRFYIYQGAGVFIAGWILSGNALAASLTSLTVPKVLPKEAVDRFLAALFTLLAGVSFVLTVIATPLPFVGRYTGPNTESTFSIWHEYTFANGDQTSKVALHKSTCGEFGTYAKFAQAFSIISIVATLVALAVGVLRVRGSGSVKGLLATGFFAALVTTITMSAELALYYKRFCTAQSALELNYHFYAGFGLFATAASLMLLAFVVILIVAIARALGAKASEGTSGNVRFGLLFVVSIAISVLFMVISLTTPVFQQDTNDTNYVKVNWWQQETVVAGAYTEQDFQCQEIWERLVGGGALGVIAIVLSAIAGLLGIGQLSNGGLRIPASAIALLAAVLQLTSFALAMGVFQGSYCNFKPYATQYKYAVGFGLMVAAFCLNAVFSLVNLVFGA